MNEIREWLKKEEVKASIARKKMRTCASGEQLFLLERAEKAEATSRVLRKALKILARMEQQ